MTSSENSCKKKGLWQVVDNKIYKSIEEARVLVQFYYNRGLSCYIETLGSGFKIVFCNCLGSELALEKIRYCRQMLKGTKQTLDIINID